MDYLKGLEGKIVSTYGKNGKEWFDKIPEIINELINDWGLSNLKPAGRMLNGYVVKGMQGKLPIVLKLTFDSINFNRQLNALQIFKGYGAVNVLSFSSKYNALLLEQAIPGTPLKDLYYDKVDENIEIYANIAAKIHSKPVIEKAPHISYWLKVIDRADMKIFDKKQIKMAIKMKNDLLDSMKNECMIHGDLHQLNIIKHGEDWVFIDPLEVVRGEKEFDIAKFIFIRKKEMKRLDCEKLKRYRLDMLLEKTNADKDRLRKWIFVRRIYSNVLQAEYEKNAKR